MAWIVKGNGTAEFRGKNSVRVEFQMENTATGEIVRKRKTMRVNKKTKAEKGRCLREYRAELESGIRWDADTVTFGQYADEWLAERKANPEIAPRTYSKDENRVKTLKLTFGKMLIGEITRQDVKRFQTAIMTADENGHAPTVSGKPISGTTAHGFRTTLRQILQEAVRDKLITENPCDDLPAPKVDTKEKEPLSMQQVATIRDLLDAGKPRPSLVALRLCLFAGLRRGEACGLIWSDFDANAGTITVRRSLCSETLEFKETKTESGVRTIPLDQGTVDYLLRFKASQARKMLALGIPVEDSCICATAGTEYMHPENLTRSVQRFGKEFNIKGISPHVLRHTYCTMLFAAGVDLKTAQYLMGHKDPMTTLKIYTHYCEANGIKAAEAVGAMVGSLPSAQVKEMDFAGNRWGISSKVS